MKHLYLIVIFLLACICADAQTSDSIIVNRLREEGVKFSHNNSITLLTTGKEKFKDLFQAIKNAKHSVHLEYFNFRNDSIARELFLLLDKKAKQGVEVRALFDAFGNSSNSSPLKNRHLDSIRTNGIEIYKFDPIVFPWINHVLARDHRKIVVIDGRIAYIGGMNVADYYINGNKKVGSWHDMHCRLEGEEVNTLQRIFLKMWNKTTGQNVHGAQYYHGDYIDTSYFTGLKPDTTESRNHKTVGIINREPHTSNGIIRCFYENVINCAKDSIKLINPYFTLNRKLKKALKNAVKRGVKVEIMLSTHSDIPLTPDCGFYNAHKLMKKGCKIWMYTPGFHHTKIIIVDNSICTIGSANLNSRSLSWDYEANAVIADKNTSSELNRIFDNYKKDSFLLDEKKWDTWRTPWQKFKGWIGHLISPFL